MTNIPVLQAWYELGFAYPQKFEKSIGIILKQQATTVTSPTSGIEVSLSNQDQWEKCHPMTTMVGSGEVGNQLSPHLEYVLKGLDSNAKYELSLHFERVDNLQSEGNEIGHELKLHKDGSMNGGYWMENPVSFEHIKITNNPEIATDHIVFVESMHKYMPVLSIQREKEEKKEFRFSVTEFIVVTNDVNDERLKKRTTKRPLKTAKDKTMVEDAQGMNVQISMDEVLKALADGRLKLTTKTTEGAGSGLVDSISRRIANFEYEPKEGQAFEDWYLRYGDTITANQRGYNYFTNRILPDKTSEFKFEEIVNKLKECFLSTRSTFARRMEFLKIIDEGGDLGEYTGRVKKAYADAKFNEMSSEQVQCLMWIKGLRTNGTVDIRARAMQIMETRPTTTLIQLEHEIMKLLEFREDARNIGGCRTSEEVFAVRKMRTEKANEQKRSSQRHLLKREKQRENEGSSTDEKDDSDEEKPTRNHNQRKKKCHRCGGEHNAMNCWAKNKECFDCGRRGHISKKCREQQDDEKSDRSGHRVNHVVAKTQKRRRDIYKVNGIYVKDSKPRKGSTEVVKNGSMKRHVRRWPDEKFVKIQRNREETGKERCKSFVTRSPNPGRKENIGVFERHDRWEKKNPKENSRLQPELKVSFPETLGQHSQWNRGWNQQGSSTPSLPSPPQPSFAMYPWRNNFGCSEMTGRYVWIPNCYEMRMMSGPDANWRGFDQNDVAPDHHIGSLSISEDDDVIEIDQEIARKEREKWWEEQATTVTSPTSGIEVSLSNQDQWEKCHPMTTMVGSGEVGNQLSPHLEYVLKGLDSNAKYELSLHFERVDNLQSEGNEIGHELKLHKDGSMNGGYWMENPVSFEHIKITNNPEIATDHIVFVESMHKYMPVLSIQREKEEKKEFRFSVTEFIVVTNDVVSLVFEILVTFIFVKAWVNGVKIQNI
ncbi:hypothetical protein CRE_09512 [Caenorhabditis remanei]|uniref:Uncharacterized protein n=1 Tax=Caenorhabditis remanei TaxID=31234 RepID=E3MIZ9_CAERE|nr:hypothetical protein CRE_09512 [Caenorhabditis remanei]